MNIAINIVSFILIVAVLFIIAAIFQRLLSKQYENTPRFLNARSIAGIGVFSALATLFMLFEVPIPFLVPEFYKIDISELPIVICAYAFGPLSGVLSETVKILLKVALKGSSTFFVGEIANFCVGCFYVMPASIIYWYKKTKRQAWIASIVSPIIMTLAACFLNALYLLPVFSLMGFPMESIVAAGHAINGRVNNLYTFIIFMTLPINLLKAAIVSVLAVFVYKPTHRYILMIGEKHRKL